RRPVRRSCQLQKTAPLAHPLLELFPPAAPAVLPGGLAPRQVPRQPFAHEPIQLGQYTRALPVAEVASPPAQVSVDGVPHLLPVSPPAQPTLLQDGPQPVSEPLARLLARPPQQAAARTVPASDRNPTMVKAQEIE